MPTLQQRRLLLNGGGGLVRPGLVGWYQVNEGVGTALNDHTGLGQAIGFGTGLSAPTWTTTGLGFTPNEFCATASPLLTARDNWAIEIVFQQTATSASNTYVVYNGSPAANGYGLYIAPTTNHLNVLFGGVVGTDLGLVPALGTWYDVVVTRVNGVASAWINGAQVGATWANTPVTPTTRTVLGSSDTTKEYLTGGIAYVLIYAAGLAAYQVVQNHQFVRRTLAARAVALS